MTRIVSYNLLHGLDLTAGGTVDLAAAARVLGGLDADVVALQEVDRGQERSGCVDQVAHLARELGVNGVFGPALRGSPDRAWEPVGEDDGGPAYGVGLLSRHRIVATRCVRLPGGGSGARGPNASLRRPGWDREPRVAMVAIVGDGPRQLAVTVTHLSYLPGRALRQLRAAADIATGRGPRVLIGDLNLPAWIVRATLPRMRHAGGEPTFPAWRPRLQMHHVLLDGAVDVERAVAHAATSSDHRPLVVDVRLRS